MCVATLGNQFICSSRLPRVKYSFYKSLHYIQCRSLHNNVIVFLMITFSITVSAIYVVFSFALQQIFHFTERRQYGAVVSLRSDQSQHSAEKQEGIQSGKSYGHKYKDSELHKEDDFSRKHEHGSPQS